MAVNEFNFNAFNSIILAGIIQGLIFAIVVLSAKKYRWTGTLILGAFILSFSLENLQYYLEDIGVITEVELMSVYFIPFQMFSGPLLLWYGLYLLDPDRKFKRVDYWLFLPFVIALLVSSVYKILFAGNPQNPALEVFYNCMESGLEFSSIVFDISILVFLFTNVRRAENEETLVPKMQLKWFRNVLVSLFVLSIIWLAVTIEDLYYYTNDWYFIYIGMSLTIYWMGHVGIYKYGIYEERKKIRNYSIEHQANYTPDKQKNVHITALENILVGDRRFLDPNMTLDRIAEEINLSKSHLSRIINAELGMGFPDYLNKLRVEEAKSYLRNPEFANYTLVAIGLEAGFNSKTTFNTAFKKITSLTPSEFRKSKEH